MNDELQKKIDNFDKHLDSVKTELIDFSRTLNEDGNTLKHEFNQWVEGITEEVDKINSEMISLLKEKINSNEAREIVRKVKNLKMGLVGLKNKQIRTYNEKIDYVNKRKEEIKKNIEKYPDLLEELNKLTSISKVDVPNDNDWKYLKYVVLLDYAKLEEVNKQLSELENKLNIKGDENGYLNSRITSLEDGYEKLKKKSNGKNAKKEANNLLNECVNSLDALIDLNITLEKSRDKLYKELFGKYSYRLVEINTKLRKLMNDLVQNKNKTGKKVNEYNLVKEKLELLERKYEVLDNKITLYNGMCNEGMLAILNGFLNNYSSELNEIKKDYEKYKDKLESNQQEQLLSRINRLEEINKDSNTKLNNNPYMLEKGKVFSSIEKTIENLDKYINEFNKELELQGDRIKDRRKIKSLNQKVNGIELRISRIRGLLSLYKENEPDNYELLKVKFDKSLNNFENSYKDYNSKRPLLVKNVKNAKNVYKKYKKETLEISGLASVSLLEGNALIPTIMHGSTVLGQKVPVLGKFTGFVNKVLGGIINAKQDKDGIWHLSNGFKIGPSVACTSIFRHMATSGETHKPLIERTKELMKKIEEKANDVKKNVSNSIDNAKENRRKKILEEIRKEIEEYCKTHTLSDEQKKELEEYLFHQRTGGKGGK